jgi:hypothetical protein
LRLRQTQSLEEELGLDVEVPGKGLLEMQFDMAAQLDRMERTANKGHICLRMVGSDVEMEV